MGCPGGLWQLEHPKVKALSNRRIETDRRQRPFATLAPSAHAGR